MVPPHDAADGPGHGLAEKSNHNLRAKSLRETPIDAWQRWERLPLGVLTTYQRAGIVAHEPIGLR
jgi:hypothetical protein